MQLLLSNTLRTNILFYCLNDNHFYGVEYTSLSDVEIQMLNMKIITLDTELTMGVLIINMLKTFTKRKLRVNMY